MEKTFETRYQIPVSLTNNNFSLYGDALLVSDCLTRYGFDLSVVRHVNKVAIAVVITSLNVIVIREAFGLTEDKIYRIDALDYINDHNLKFFSAPTAILNNTLCNNA